MLCCEFLNIIAILQFFEYLKLRKRSLRPPKKHNHKEYKQIMYMYNNAILKGFSGIKIWKIILHVLVISIQCIQEVGICVYIYQKTPKVMSISQYNDFISTRKLIFVHMYCLVFYDIIFLTKFFLALLSLVFFLYPCIVF